jgi:predicted phosphohydrolase
MALYAISDLHLSLGSDKPMDIFGELWRDHHIKVSENWNNKITPGDTVLIAGDISWAMKFEEAFPDLEFIHGLPGQKLFIKGNHDYWWAAISKLNSLYDDMIFIQNTYYKYKDYGICGTRGWINLEEDGAEHDEKIHKRELLRLKMSIDSAKKDGVERIIVMLHYPPLTRAVKNQDFLQLLSQYDVEKVVYGHIHNSAREACINGTYNKIEYICTSADIINFDPVRIL